jgi:hypothetical protein
MADIEKPHETPPKHEPAPRHEHPAHKPKTDTDLALETAKERGHEHLETLKKHGQEGWETMKGKGKEAYDHTAAGVQNIREGNYTEGLKKVAPAGLAALIGIPLIMKKWGAVKEGQGFMNKVGRFFNALLWTGAVVTGGVFLVNEGKTLMNRFEEKKKARDLTAKTY